MKLITDTDTISLIKNNTKSQIKDITNRYCNIAVEVHKNKSFFQKHILPIFKMPPSLRFFHVAEFVADENELKEMVYLREIYHSMYWVSNELKVPLSKKNIIIQLNDFDSKEVIQVADYLNIDLVSYSNTKYNNNAIKMNNNKIEIITI